MAFIKRRKGKSPANLLMAKVSGTIGGLVIKQYKDKTVVSAGPGPRKKSSKLQKDRQQMMKTAVRFAKAINNDPVKKALWKKAARNHTNVYQAAVSWFMKNSNDRSAVPPHISSNPRR